MFLDSLDYTITGNTIKKTSWEQDAQKALVKALRELQQKRLMEDPTIKNLKETCKIAYKNYQCPVCSTTGHDILQAAHVGTIIKTKINDIVNKYFNTLSFNELLDKVIQEENNSIIQICCRKCNKQCE
tara:strand:+ start:968 stop:1351 length:384 start_codon:yes stop_codon:yes gene_type:complete